MRSDAVKKGMQQAPHRSLFHALGHDQRKKWKNRWWELSALIMKSYRDI